MVDRDILKQVEQGAAVMVGAKDYENQSLSHLYEGISLQAELIEALTQAVLMLDEDLAALKQEQKQGWSPLVEEEVK